MGGIFHLIFSLGLFTLCIVIVVKFFHIAADLRAIKQSMPTATGKLDLAGILASADKAAYMGCIDQAKQILLGAKYEMQAALTAHKAGVSVMGDLKIRQIEDSIAKIDAKLQEIETPTAKSPEP